MIKNIKTCINCHLNEGGHLSPNCCGNFDVEITAEDVLSECTGMTINDEDAYIIHTKTEYIIKAMEKYAVIKSKQLLRKDEKI